MMIYYIIKIVLKEFLKMKNKEFDIIKEYVDQNIDSPDLLSNLKKTIQEKISKYSVTKILNILKNSNFYPNLNF